MLENVLPRTCHFLLAMNLLCFSVDNLLALIYFTSWDNHWCPKHCSTLMRFLMSLTRRLEMKSLASSEISSKVSSSKSHCAMVTLTNVSASESPRNGDRPERLEYRKDLTRISKMCVQTMVQN